MPNSVRPRMVLIAKKRNKTGGTEGDNTDSGTESQKQGKKEKLKKSKNGDVEKKSCCVIC